jgi:hypothetical protein
MRLSTQGFGRGQPTAQRGLFGQDVIHAAHHCRARGSKGLAQGVDVTVELRMSVAKQLSWHQESGREGVCLSLNLR